MSPNRCSQQLAAGAEQQTRWNNCVVDDTDGVGCWRRRAGGKWSVTAGISRRSNQNSNWMWRAYRSSDSSQQCHSVANSTADRLNSIRQSHHPQHTLHKLRAWRLTKIHSTVDIYLTSDLKCRGIGRPVWTQWRSRDFSSHGSKQVKTGQHSRNSESATRQRHSRLWQCSLCVHRYNQWQAQIHIQICKSTTSLDIW